MRVLSARMHATTIRRFFTQLILVLLINVPSISFGLAMGWVSLESGSDVEGEVGAAGAQGGAALVGAAAVTFLAGALAMPAAARAIAAGRKPAMLATSAAFILCWSLKLCGGWGVVAGRAAAGLGGTAAWVIPPMLALEMCCARVRGAAAVALVLAHNVGFLLMYLAADYQIPHRTVLLCCLGLSVAHFIAYIFVPESPAYLAANGKLKEARASLAWCRGLPADSVSAELDAELRALPEPDLEPVSPFRLAKDMLSDVRRRKAFMIALVAVVGQEMCGVLTMLQFAERMFTLAREGEGEGEGEGLEGGGGRPASDAVVLGVVQLVASALALYLVEKIGRRPLLVWGAVCTGAGLCRGAGAVLAGWRRAALPALAAAVFADSAGLQPAPYALLAEMFTYQYRGCASLLVTAASDLANALEIVVFPCVVQTAGLGAALALAGTLTLLLAASAAALVPETMDRSPEEIYQIICPGIRAEREDENEDDIENGNEIVIVDDIDASKIVSKIERDDDFLKNKDVDENNLSKDEGFNDENYVKRLESLSIIKCAENVSPTDDADSHHKIDKRRSKGNSADDESEIGRINPAFIDDVIDSPVTKKEKKDRLEDVPTEVEDKRPFSKNNKNENRQNKHRTNKSDSKDLLVGNSSAGIGTVQEDQSCRHSSSSDDITSEVKTGTSVVESTHF